MQEDCISMMLYMALGYVNSCSDNAVFWTHMAAYVPISYMCTLKGPG